MLDPECGTLSVTAIGTDVIPIPTLTAAEAIEGILGLTAFEGNAGVGGAEVGAVQVFILDSALSKLLI